MPKINISIDDVTPHPYSDLKVIEQCNRVIERFPDAKFTFFIPTAYWRSMPSNRPLDTTTFNALTLSKYPDFTAGLRALPKEHFEFAFHGHFHGVPHRSNNDEFRNFTCEEAAERFRVMFAEVKAANLVNRFIPVFRPPAMWMSAGTFEAAKAVGIECLALSSKDIHKRFYEERDESYEHVVYTDVWPPDDALEDLDPDKQPGQLEFLYHACQWDGGYFNETAADELIEWLEKHDHEFSFFEGLYG